MESANPGYFCALSEWPYLGMLHDAGDAAAAGLEHQAAPRHNTGENRTHKTNNNALLQRPKWKL
jgi:hypothetical protein